MAHHKDFKGGIQKGMVATDESAKRMDDNAKESMEVVFDLLKDSYPNLRYTKKLSQNQIPGGVGSCAPDGGVWWIGDKIIAAFESKKQGSKGNAIERWFKNNFIIRNINPSATYVTFASGEGVMIGNAIYRILHVAHCGDFGVINEVKVGVNNLHCKVEGFSKDEMILIMIDTIESILK